MSGVHQFVPMLHVGDAVGRHTLRLRDLLRERGVDSEIYVERGDPETVHATRLARSYPDGARPGDVLVYQFATESVLVPWLAARTEILVVNYHNVTPPESFAPWDNALARAQLRARGQLAVLAGRSTLAVAVSEFNRADLTAAGYQATAVVPPMVELAERAALAPGDGNAGPAGPATTDTGSGDVAEDGSPAPVGEWSGSRWLMVGRLAPNKAVEEVVDALFLYRRHHDSGAGLLVIGRPAVGSYVQALHEHVAELGLVGAVRFAGRVDDRELATAYRRAGVLVVASEHEGFCLPVVEAMVHDLPVVAYREGAVPEVLGDAGLLVDRNDPWSLATAVHRLASDERLRAGLVSAGRQRFGSLGLAGAGTRLVELLLAVRDRRPLPPGVPTGGPQAASTA